jgi:hypothetical protein
MAFLDLSKYAATVGTYSQEEAAKAVEDKFRPLDAGVHECTLIDFKKSIPAGSPEGTEPQVCILAKDPNWLQFTPVFENGAGQRTSICIMMPLTGTLQYLGQKGPTTYPYKTFMCFVAALGFDPLEEERTETTFMRAITKTNGTCLDSLIGAQVKVKVEWNDKKFLHPQYDSETKVYYLVNHDGFMPDELNEPFEINKEVQGDARWAEMEQRAKEAGYLFQRQPNVNLLRHDTVKNDLSVFFPKKVQKAAATITKVATKPAVATLKKPEVATKPPTKPVVTDEELTEDDSIPDEE